jgi:hypothetical protein
MALPGGQLPHLDQDREIGRCGHVGSPRLAVAYRCGPESGCRFMSGHRWMKILWRQQRRSQRIAKPSIILEPRQGASRDNALLRGWRDSAAVFVVGAACSDLSGVKRDRGCRTSRRRGSPSAMSTKSRDTIFGGQLMGAQIRAEGAREDARGGYPEGRSSVGRAMVDPHGRRRWAGAAVPNDRAMSQRRSRLAAGKLPSLQNGGEHPTRLHPPAKRHGDLEARGLAEMSIMLEG